MKNKEQRREVLLFLFPFSRPLMRKEQGTREWQLRVRLAPSFGLARAPPPAAPAAASTAALVETVAFTYVWVYTTPTHGCPYAYR
jgi:hypothetical protein